MKPIIFIMMLFTSKTALGDPPKSGDWMYVSGYERGELVVPVINVWKSYAQRHKGIVCQLSGDGSEKYHRRGLGSVVKIIGLEEGGIKIESVVNRCVGFIGDHFLAKKVSKKDCKKAFSHANVKTLLEECLKAVSER